VHTFIFKVALMKHAQQPWFASMRFDNLNLFTLNLNANFYQIPNCVGSCQPVDHQVESQVDTVHRCCVPHVRTYRSVVSVRLRL